MLTVLYIINLTGGSHNLLNMSIRTPLWLLMSVGYINFLNSEP